MISVVMATYNGENFIEKQLISILNQTLKADEVLIADDCSTDNTAKIIQDFIMKNDLINWKFEVNKSNLGYRRNFYNLLKKTQGDIIFLADQDDEWYNQKIEKMVDTIEKNKNIKTLCCTVDLIDAQSREIKLPKLPNLYNSNFTFSEKTLKDINYFGIKEIMASNISPGCSMCITKEINREFLETYDFDLPHDWHMTLISSLFDKGCCLLNIPLIGYRLHSNNAIGSTSGGGIRGSLRNFRRKEKIVEFEGRIKTFDKLRDYFKLDSGDISYVREYTNARLNFYKKPNIATLRRLRSYKEYWITSKKKGRAFDLLVALHIDWILYMLYGEKR